MFYALVWQVTGYLYGKRTAIHENRRLVRVGRLYVKGI